MLGLLCTSLLGLTLVSSVYSDDYNSTAAPEAASGPPSLTPKLFSTRGANITLPCRFPQDLAGMAGFMGMRVKWTKVMDDDTEEDVYLSMGFHKKSFGGYNGRIRLVEADDNDASLMINDIVLSDMGTYRCELINGMDDSIQEVTLEVQGSIDSTDGVVFPYSPRLGRYNLNFHDAEAACLGQDSDVASFDQLYEAWRGGLDWCNAGWLNDGSVQYPITNPRAPCGGTSNGAGVRSYGQRDKTKSRYDVFCYTSELKGRFYWLVQPDRLTFDEAVQACLDDGAEIAKVGQIYAAWKLHGYDRCDAGWLADGSVRYPISNPRKNCSPTEAAVRFLGFPDKKQKLYGVYCFKPQQ